MSDESRHRVTKYGYVEILLEDVPADNPYAAPGAWKFPWIPEAKVVAAQTEGRILERWEVVHHKNGDKTDNSVENLEIMDKDEHAAMHAAARPKGVKEATVVVELAEAEGVELFRDRAGVTYASIHVDGHRETWPIESERFGRWLQELFYRDSNAALGNDGLRDGRRTLSAKATFGGSEREVDIRIARLNGRLYVDLCDDLWRAVEVDRGGWRIVDDPPVRFIRSPEMLPLPEPIHEPGSGALDELVELLNLEPDESMLALGWVVGCFNPEGPYLALEITGEHGSGKSTLVAALRSFVDPADPPHISAPRSEEDLMTIAASSWVMAFDNMSFLTNDMSDSLARLATGGAFKRRKLFTHDTITFKASRPILLNGISDVVSRPDLQDRLVTLELPRIGKGLADAELRDRLDQLRPRVLGEILSAIANGMALSDQRTTEGDPAIEIPSARMKTAYNWIVLTAATLFRREGSGGQEFVDAFEENKSRAVFIALDDSPLTETIVLISRAGGFGLGSDKSKNTVGELLQVIRYSTRPDDRKSKRFPDNAKALKGALKRLAPSLRTAYGIEVEFPEERTKYGYLVSISATDPDADRDDDDGRPVPSGASPALVEAVKKQRVDPLNPKTNRREKERRRRQRDDEDPRYWMTADRLDKERYDRSQVSSADLADNPFYNRRFRNEEEYKATHVVVQFLRFFS